jgi:hypothetical protein
VPTTLIDDLAHDCHRNTLVHLAVVQPSTEFLRILLATALAS